MLLNKNWTKIVQISRNQKTNKPQSVEHSSPNDQSWVFHGSLLLTVLNQQFRACHNLVLSWALTLLRV